MDIDTTITITIGRNIGSKPMSAAKWAKFRQWITWSLTAADATVFVADAKSAGSWEGIAEESRTWVARVTDGRDITQVEGDLADACVRFQQDAIALTTGTTSLVTATTNVEPATCRRWTHCFDRDCGCGPCPGCGNRKGARASR